MKILTCLAASTLVLAGCATTEPTQLAQAECKIVPATTESAAGRAPRNVSALERREAENALASSSYRLRGLRTDPTNNVEQALRDCR